MASATLFTKKDLLERNEARYKYAGYRETHALLIHWEDDDLKARSDLRSLEFVLRDNYAITTRLISIPSRDYMDSSIASFTCADPTFKREVNEFIRLYSAPDILLIVVYLGRGTYDDSLTFTLKGLSNEAAKEQRKIIPKFSWSVAKGGLIQAASDVVMLFDLRGDVGDEIPPVSFDTSNIPLEPSINALIISYSAPGTPGDNGKSFAYTKILRDYLRKMGTNPHLMVSEAHEHVVNHINRAIDHGGLAFAPLYHNFSLNQSHHVPLITFDITEPSVNILGGSGDYKWGPLGRLPLNWQKVIDNNDQYWRPYFKNNNTGKLHATRPWSSACRAEENELWDASRFAKVGAEHVLGRIIASGKHVEELSTGSGECVTASHDFSSWMTAVLRHRQERARKEAEQVALLQVMQPKAVKEESVRQQELVCQERMQQEALQQLAHLQRQEADRQIASISSRPSGLGQSIYATGVNVKERGRSHVKFSLEPKEVSQEQVITAQAQAEDPSVNQQISVRSAQVGVPNKIFASAWEAFIANQARR